MFDQTFVLTAFVLTAHCSLLTAFPPNITLAQEGGIFMLKEASLLFR
jgi:hypothetical protein